GPLRAFTGTGASGARDARRGGSVAARDLRDARPGRGGVRAGALLHRRARPAPPALSRAGGSGALRGAPRSRRGNEPRRRGSGHLRRTGRGRGNRRAGPLASRTNGSPGEWTVESAGRWSELRSGARSGPGWPAVGYGVNTSTAPLGEKFVLAPPPMT